ncbi:MAG: hypothetical protein ACXABO_01120 [Promethearchaeota archaeon]|jgi:hypothetical protein
MNTIIKYSDFEANVGKNVKIVGKIANEIWQHITTILDSHPYMEYFDIKDGHQIVIYAKDSVSCEGETEIVGKLIEVESRHKDPRSKISDKYSEYQLIVDSWKCL